MTAGPRSVVLPGTRSLLRTIMSEFVAPAPDGVWKQTLIGALVVTGLKGHAARQTVARAIENGWLRTERRGRQSRVFLSDDSLELIGLFTPRVDAFGDPWEWDGRWLVVALRVPEERREVRHAVRSKLAWAGFGALGNGMWISPHVEREEELRRIAVEEPDATMIWFRSAELGGLLDRDELVEAAWDLGAVAEGYDAFIARFAGVRPDGPEAAFRELTQLAHEWRRFPLDDPDLPAVLLPDGWPLPRALRVFRDRRAAWQEPAQAWFRTLDVFHDPRGAAARAQPSQA